MKRLESLFQLFYPKSCASCNLQLLTTEHIICTNCRHDLPFFDNKDFKSNLLGTIFKGRVHIEKAGAFFIFRKNGKAKNLIHQLKYKGKQEIGTFLGEWWGNHLNSLNIFNDVDCIIPVPLHKKKFRKRGYNQLTTFGLALSKELNIPYREDILHRNTATKTQTYKNRFERFLNTETKFDLKDNSIESNKYFLLIDDVVTTGATIEACCKELRKRNHVKISVLTMAFTA